MGRPPLGRSAKANVVSIRVTDAEKKKLEEDYRSASKGVRAIVTAALAKREEKK